ncbi:hypothetical protein D3C71_1214030 [compost metagenome]
MAAPASCATVVCSSRLASASPMSPAPACRLRPRPTARNWPVLHGAPAACRWCSIRAIPTCPPPTPTCVTSRPSAMAKKSPPGSVVVSTSPRSIRSTRTCGTGTAWRAICAHRLATSVMPSTSAGAMSISSSSTATKRAVSAVCSSTICTAISTPTSLICARRVMVSLMLICRWSSSARTRRMASASANSSCIGADATSSSTWSTIVARCSACRVAAAARAS